MTTFKSVLTGVALAGTAALLPAGASAEGLSDRGYRAAPPPGVTWTGFYVGLNAGYAWGDASLRSKFGCPDDFCAFTSPANLDFVSALGTGGGSVDGFTGGIQAGYNWQRGNIVFGLEADFNSLDLGGTLIGAGVLPDGVGQTAAVGTALSAEWFLTVRARLGVTLSPNVLAYATGGLALTELEVANAYVDNGVGAPSPVAGASSNSDMRAGWTVGGGIEWAIDRNWTIRGEYLYVDFGSVSTTASVAPTVNDPTVTPNTLDTTADLTTHILRAGINYKF